MNKRIDKKKQQKQAKTIAAAPVKTEQETEINFYIQYQEQEYLEKEVIEKVKEKCLSEGLDAKDLKSISIYLKLEDKKAYYTVDGGISGAVSL